eukprot:gene17202-751_t
MTKRERDADGVATADTDVITEFSTLHEGALAIRNTANIADKAKLSAKVFDAWNSGKLPVGAPVDLPGMPARQEDLHVIKPGDKFPKRTGSLAGQIATIHSLAHIEGWAVDLSWDIVARASQMDVDDGAKLESLPKEFYDDWV